MYITNLPDEVMIPDSLVHYIDEDDLTGQAHVDAEAWVVSVSSAEPDVRSFWKRQIDRNVTACRRYGIPECAEYFAVIYELIDKTW